MKLRSWFGRLRDPANVRRRATDHVRARLQGFERLSGRQLLAADLQVLADPTEEAEAFSIQSFDAGSEELADDSGMIKMLAFSTIEDDSLIWATGVFDEKQLSIDEDSGVPVADEWAPEIRTLSGTVSEDDPKITERTLEDSDVIFQTLGGPVLASGNNTLRDEDVNGDHVVTGLDILLVINAINKYGATPTADISSLLQGASGEDAAIHERMDVNGDAVISALDALILFDYVNSNDPSAVDTRLMNDESPVAPPINEARMRGPEEIVEGDQPIDNAQEDDADRSTLAVGEDVSSTDDDASLHDLKVMVCFPMDEFFKEMNEPVDPQLTTLVPTFDTND